MEVNLLDKMLAAYQEQRTPVTIVLQNRTRLTGRIRAFDNYIIALESAKHEMVYRHAVAHLSPSAAAQERRPARQRIERQKPAAEARKRDRAEAGSQKPRRQAAKAPDAPASSGINTGMKEGLLRWMQEQKTSK